MNEIIKGPNKRGREDFENAISDDLRRKIFKIFPLCANHGGASWEWRAI
jgi:hypothetical protein